MPNRWLRRGERWLPSLALLVGLTGLFQITDPALPAPDHALWGAVLWGCVGIFALHLIVRLANVGARRGVGLRVYLLSIEGIADVLAALAVPLAVLLTRGAPDAWLAGLIWVLKLAPATSGMRRLKRVLAIEAGPIAAVACLFLIVLITSAAALFMLERHVQENFNSMPKALWWAVVTLTTTGYGDVVPQTAGGRLVAGLVMISGLGVLGLWTGIMATGFALESRRLDFLSNWELVMRVPLFRTLDAASIAELARLLRRLDVPEETELYDEGDVADCIYFIVSGEVEIDLEPMDVRLGPGNFFGEMSLLEGRARSSTVIARRPTTLLVLDVMDFRTFTAHHPALAGVIEAQARARAVRYPASA